MSRIAHKVDCNQLEIKLALIAAGYTVWDMSASGFGVPDLLVASKKDAFVFLEVKQKNGKLTVKETLFFMDFELCPVYTVRSIEDALEAMRIEDNRLWQ